MWLRPKKTNPALVPLRRWSQEEFESRLAYVDARARQVRLSKILGSKNAKSDTVEFCEQTLGFKPTDYQKELIRLFNENQFVAARWCRQSGKSFTVCAMLLHYALMHPGSHIALIGPSWRQTKRNIQRIAYFLRKLPPEFYSKPQATRIRVNDSVIEAFPNNPDTIRGPTLNVIWWDETNFTPHDEELYDAIVFTTVTTRGKVVCASTPWNRDSVFWKMCNDEGFIDYKRSHVTCEGATEPNGPLKRDMIEILKRQFGGDSERWQREMMAEWAEGEHTWLSQSLIVSCIGTVKTCGQDMKLWNEEVNYEGTLFAGLDLAQVRDYSVLAILQRVNDLLLLRHLEIFSQPTKYANVLGRTKILQDRWGGFAKIKVDITKDGPSIISEMDDAGIQNAEGVVLSARSKSEVAELLKQRMFDKKLFYPHLTWERPYRSDLCSELNTERYEYRKDGTVGLDHPSGTHDDVFWSIALAVYAAGGIKTSDDVYAMKLI
jgi:phage FluMu gp28-like protein